MEIWKHTYEVNCPGIYMMHRTDDEPIWVAHKKNLLTVQIVEELNSAGTRCFYLVLPEGDTPTLQNVETLDPEVRFFGPVPELNF